MQLLNLQDGHQTTLSRLPDGTTRCHVFEEHTIGAVNAALVAGRPLLVRGEPGLGKTQLAEAVAEELQRAYLPFVVDSRTEQRDLLWHYDAVERLAEAQLCHATMKPGDTLGDRLNPERFVRPRPLWWALNWDSANTALGSHPSSPLALGQNNARKDNGWVLLVDEIDKAETDVPNGLLEAFGALQFTPYGAAKPVTAKGTPPLVIITTNEERTLPPAFLRRCFVLLLEMPNSEQHALTWLVQRGRSHFGSLLTEPILKEAAQQLWKDRQDAQQKQWRPLPGLAEYIDMLRVLANTHPRDVTKQEDLLKHAARYVFQKHAAL